jgi:hypothetical protein
MRYFAMFALILAGCSSSHPRGEGMWCDGEWCEAPNTCCMGYCAAVIECGGGVDGGSYCGSDVCDYDETCCAGCPGQEDFCAEGSGCPDIACPPPPPGCIDCGFGGEICCPGCEEGEGFCSSGGICPELECPPPPACDECAAGETCCPSCPGDPPYCSSTTECPEFDCPSPICDCPAGTTCCFGCDGTVSCIGPGEPCSTCPSFACDDDSPCPDGFYCDHDAGCGGPGQCEPTPTGCPRDCPGVCGCNGDSYCNSCVAASAGVDVEHAGVCGEGECGSRSYCACDGGCEPLVDLSTGCICVCDDPFNCSGTLCDCDCGGATYLGCAPRGQCADPTPNCGLGCNAVLGADGCPICVCTDSP